MTHSSPPDRQLSWPYGCPFCGSPVTASSVVCGHCSLPLQDSRAERICVIDLAVMAGDHRREQLLAERHAMLAEYDRSRRMPPAPPVPPAPPTPTAPTGPPAGSGPDFPAPPAPSLPSFPSQTQSPSPSRRPRFEVRFRDTQTTLLVLGGTLVALAALVFAVVTWRASSPAVHAAMLVAVSVLAAAAPIALRRRALLDTAETLGTVAAALVAVDVLLARHLVAPGLDGRAFWAIGTAGLAAAYLTYGRVLRLAGPQILAVLVGQAPLLLLAARVCHTPGSASVLIGLAAFGNGLGYWFLSRASSSTLVRHVSRAVTAACGAGLWAVGGLTAASDVLLGWSSTARVVGDCALLIGYAGLVAALGALRPATRLPASVVAAGLTVLATATAAANAFRAHNLPSVALCLVVPTVAALAASVTLPRSWRQGPLAVVAAGLVASGAIVLPELIEATQAAIRGIPLANLDRGLAACLLATVALTCVGATALARIITGTAHWWRAAVAGSTLATVAALPLVAPLTPFVLAIAAMVAAAGLVALALTAVLRDDYTIATWLAGCLLSAYAVALARGDYGHLAVALAVLAAVAAMSAVRNLFRPSTAATGTLAAALAAAAGWQAAGWQAAGSPLVPAPLAALGVLLSVAAGLVIADRRGHELATSATGMSVEAVTVTAASFATVATLPIAGAGWFAWALAICGVGTLAQSLRPARTGAAYIGLGLVSLSSWIHLGVHDVHLVEAYSVPISLVVLGIGMYRRHVDATLSSQRAYAAGLVGALVPSLFAGLEEGPSTRSALVLVAAGGVALLGARTQLTAPLVIGSAVALADALWLGVPTLAAVPRWVSLGTVGAVLLFVGATYERRRQQAERVAAQIRTFA